jgi:hypothetical protein
MIGILLLTGDVVIAIAAVILAAAGTISWVLAAPVAVVLSVLACLIARELWEDWA